MIYLYWMYLLTITWSSDIIVFNNNLSRQSVQVLVCWKWFRPVSFWCSIVKYLKSNIKTPLSPRVVRCNGVLMSGWRTEDIFFVQFTSYYNQSCEAYFIVSTHRRNWFLKYCFHLHIYITRFKFVLFSSNDDNTIVRCGWLTQRKKKTKKKNTILGASYKPN